MSGMMHHVIGLILFYEQNQRRLATVEQRDSWSAAGSSLFKGGWDMLAHKLLSQGINRFRCKDVSAMESSVVSDIQKVIYKSREVSYRDGMTWPTDPDFDEPLNYRNLFRWWLQNTIYSTVVDFEGKVWLKFGQNASGQYLTLFDNIDAMELVFSYHLAKKCYPEQHEYEAFVAKKVLLLMGDDSIFPDEKCWEGLDDSASECGFVMTDEVPEPVPLTDAKFCGFSWIKAKYGMYVYSANVDKLMANIFFHMKQQSNRLAYAKACAARVLLYPLQNRDFQIVNMMLGHMRTQLHTEMRGEYQMDNIITYEGAMAQYKTDQEIEQLIYGVEGSVRASKETLPTCECAQDKVVSYGTSNVNFSTDQDGRKEDEESREEDRESDQESGAEDQQTWETSQWWRSILHRGHRQESHRSVSRYHPL